MNDHTNELYHYGILGMKWGKRRYQNKDGSLTSAGKKRYDKPNDDYIKVHSKKKISQMSNDELKNRNNRLQMEKNYRELTRKTNIGKKATQAFISTAGTIAAVTTAYSTYKKIADNGLDKIGNYILKGINLSKPFD